MLGYEKRSNSFNHNNFINYSNTKINIKNDTNLKCLGVVSIKQTVGITRLGNLTVSLYLKWIIIAIANLNICRFLKKYFL